MNTNTRLGTLTAIFKDAASAWVEDKITTFGAALAYYTLFSLVPLLLIALTIIGAVYGSEAARADVLGEIQDAAGETTARAIADILEMANRSRSTGLTILAVISLLLGASGMFVELQEALNLIWKTYKKPSSGIINFLRERLISLSAVIVTGLLLLALATLSMVLAAMSTLLRPESVPGGLWLWQLLVATVSFAFITILFALVFKLLPETHVAWKDVWLGALVASVLFSLGKHLFGLYLSTLGVTSSFGAASSLVVILLWVYYSSAIILFGAEVSYAYARRVGSLQHSEHLESKPTVRPLLHNQPMQPGMPLGTDGELSATPGAGEL
jgi:membrane protein